jgi:hypothetical protein
MPIGRFGARVKRGRSAAEFGQAQNLLREAVNLWVLGAFWAVSLLRRAAR